MIVVNIGDHVRRRDEVSTTVSARSGRVIAGKVQTHSGGGHKRIALVLGASRLGTTWYFPDGFFSSVRFSEDDSLRHEPPLAAAWSDSASRGSPC